MVQQKNNKIIDYKLMSKIKTLANFNLYKKIQVGCIYAFVLIILLMVFYLIFCIYQNNYYIYTLCFLCGFIIVLLTSTIYFFVFLKSIKRKIIKNIDELYEIYFNKKPNKNLKFKQTNRYIQKKGVDPIKGITQYYYDQVVLFLESNE